MALNLQEIIPQTRPAVLLEDSYSLHLSPEAIQLTDNQTLLFTFPAHTGQLLQPLGVCRTLKAASFIHA
jgi:hypothetical protein